MRNINLRAASIRELVRVEDIGDLDYLVKESEVVTGQPGREFVVLGADRPAFRVKADAAGYEIARVDDPTCGQNIQLATVPDLAGHTLGNALRCGLLFTAPLQ